MRKLTAELIISGVIVSFLETLLLYALGVLNYSGIVSLLFVGILLTIIELILMFIIEELLIRTKHHIKKRIKKY